MMALGVAIATGGLLLVWSGVTGVDPRELLTGGRRRIAEGRGGLIVSAGDVKSAANAAVTGARSAASSSPTRVPSNVR